MSLYRLSIVNGVLHRQKRALLRWWVWVFNRSEEDRLTLMKNNLVKAQHAARTLTIQIKQETERIKQAKEKIQNWGGSSPSWRDRWTYRQEPKILQENVNVAHKKKERVLKSEPTELARVVVGHNKFASK